METLPTDLILLSIRPNGVIGTSARLRYGLLGSELVRLAALRRVDIERGRIVILDDAPTGDALLDEALASMRGGRRPPTAKSWVAAGRKDVTRQYLERLAAAGTIGAERRKALGLVPVTGWRVLEVGRLAEARARLDAIAHGSGEADAGQAALAGLAGAIGLPPLVYPGFAAHGARKRIRTAGRGAARPAQAAAATDAAAAAATAAATDAATAAAIQASIDGATQAAVSAATEAAHHAAAHGGAAGGGHH